MSAELHILLVEDEPVDVMTVRRALRSRDLAVRLDVAESAEDALDGLRLARPPGTSSGQLPDLVLADLRLPRLSGLDLLERLKSDGALRRLPFVMFSTSKQESEVSRAYDLGAAGYFVKPMAFEDYADTIQDIVRFGGRSERVAVVPKPLVEGGSEHYLQVELHAIFDGEGVVFDSLDDAAADGIWYRDLQRPEHKWMSPGFWRTFGYDPETRPHLATSWQDIVDQDDLETAKLHFEKHLADPEHAYDQTLRYRHRDGSTVWIRCRGVVIRDAEGTPVRMLGVHTDVTRSKAAERQLEDARLKLDAIDALLGESGADEQGGGTNLRLGARIRALLDTQSD